MIRVRYRTGIVRYGRELYGTGTIRNGTGMIRYSTVILRDGTGTILYGKAHVLYGTARIWYGTVWYGTGMGTVRYVTAVRASRKPGSEQPDRVARGGGGVECVVYSCRLASAARCTRRPSRPAFRFKRVPIWFRLAQCALPVRVVHFVFVPNSPDERDAVCMYSRQRPWPRIIRPLRKAPLFAFTPAYMENFP